MYILGTSHKLLNHYLREVIEPTREVDYLEGIELAADTYKATTVILSEYIFMITKVKNESNRYEELYSVVERLRATNVRVILLLSYQAPKWFLYECLHIGVYDFILSDSKITLDMIVTFINEPVTEKQAHRIIQSTSFMTGDAIDEQIKEEPSNATITQAITIDENFHNMQGLSFSFSSFEKKVQNEFTKINELELVSNE